MATTNTTNTTTGAILMAAEEARSIVKEFQSEELKRATTSATNYVTEVAAPAIKYAATHGSTFARFTTKGLYGEPLAIAVKQLEAAGYKVKVEKQVNGVITAEWGPVVREVVQLDPKNIV